MHTNVILNAAVYSGTLCNCAYAYTHTRGTGKQELTYIIQIQDVIQTVIIQYSIKCYSKHNRPVATPIKYNIITN